MYLQGDHTKCHASSPCQQPGYVSNKKLITSDKAVAAYKKKLTSTLIYRFADSFCRVYNVNLANYSYMTVCNFQCRDTFWVESFNHQLLTYLPKRIHFGTSAFKMRMNLAILDWVSQNYKVT